LGCVWLAWRGRLGWALAGLAMIAVGSTMRRNMTAAALVMGPAMAVAGGMAGAWLGARRWELWRGLGGSLAAVALVIGGTLGTLSIVGGQWYESEGWWWRFGVGMDRTFLLMDTAAWLDEHLETEQPIFVGYNDASNLVYFSKKVTGAPLLSNTWAYPPDRLRLIIQMGRAAADFDPIVRRWGMEVAAVEPDEFTANLIQNLHADPDWRLIRREEQMLIFARRPGAER
jgi:hypothetical protein